MLSTVSPTPFVYVQSDLRPDQTLAAWRGQRNDARRAARRPRRLQLRLPILPALRPRFAS
ncbi:MAG TPA: hypothetical protein VF549_07475 [Solirubrobacteraceae bacterium]|jgi:hypothetical protein